MSAPVPIPVDAELEQEGATWVDQAGALVIGSQSDLDFAGECLATVRLRLEQADALFAEPLEKSRASVRAAEAARSAVLEALRNLRDPFERAERALKLGIAGYFAACQREAMAAEAARRRADEARRTVEDAAAKAGVALPRRPVEPAPRPSPVPELPKGAQAREKRVATVTDLRALVRAIAAGEAPLELVAVDQRKLDKLASVLEQAPPGVTFETRTEIAHATRRGRSTS